MYSLPFLCILLYTYNLLTNKNALIVIPHQRTVCHAQFLNSFTLGMIFSHSFIQKTFIRRFFRLGIKIKQKKKQSLLPKEFIMWD